MSATTTNNFTTLTYLFDKTFNVDDETYDNLYDIISDDEILTKLLLVIINGLIEEEGCKIDTQNDYFYKGQIISCLYNSLPSKKIYNYYEYYGRDVFIMPLMRDFFCECLNIDIDEFIDQVIFDHDLFELDYDSDSDSDC